MAKELLAYTYIGAPVGLGIVDSLNLCAYSKGLCDDERVYRVVVSIPPIVAG